MQTITRRLVPFGVPSSHRRPVIVVQGGVTAPQDLATVEFTHEHRPSFVLGKLEALEVRNDGAELWATVTLEPAPGVPDDLVARVIAEHTDNQGGFSPELSPWTASHDQDGRLIVTASELLGITWTTDPTWSAGDAD